VGGFSHGLQNFAPIEQLPGAFESFNASLS